MKKLFVLLRVVLVFAALFALVSCGDWTGTYRLFGTALQGKWETNSPPDFLAGYKGVLIIDSDTITITGYEGSIGFGANENTRPFASFTKGAALSGYSEKTKDLDYPDHKGTLYIKDAGVWQQGIAYSFYRTGSYPYKYYLRFIFGGREETLRKTS